MFQLKLSIHFVLLLVIAYACMHQVDKPRKEKPNVIILYADDMGYGDLACQNPESKIPTPNLDQLAVEGMRFSDGHSSSGICTPSRYALLTGRYHWRDFHGIVGPMGKPVFKEGQFTLAQMFREHGYFTGCIGKWHLGWDWDSVLYEGWTDQDSMMLFNRMRYFYPPEAYDWTLPIPGGPLDHGFDYYYGDGTINFPPYTWIENNRVISKPTITMRHPEGAALEGQWEARPGPAVEGWDFYEVLPTLIEKAVEFVRDQEGGERPFFMYVPFNSPHAPIVPSEKFRGESGAGPYGDFVFQTDWGVGEILAALKEIGEADNTIVIFTSDNGPERYAYERIRNYGHHSAWPFRGLKRDVFEGGHHVPFLVRWPGKIPANTVSADVIHQVDLLRTLATLTGAKVPQGLAHDSHDFADIWLGTSGAGKVRTVTVHNTFEGRYAVRKGDWIFINDSSGYHSRVPDWINDHMGYDELDQDMLLYNLKEDIGQKSNLSQDMPEMVEELKEALATARKQETFIE